MAKEKEFFDSLLNNIKNIAVLLECSDSSDLLRRNIQFY
jgi:hypothetical protein